LAALRVEVGEGDGPERASANARQPDHVTGDTGRSAVVLGEHAERGVSEWIEYGGDDQGAVGKYGERR